MWTKGQLRLGCGHFSVPADYVQEGVQITGPWRGRQGQTPPPPLAGHGGPGKLWAQGLWDLLRQVVPVSTFPS